MHPSPCDTHCAPIGDQGADDLVNWMTKVESGRSELNELMTAWRVDTDARFGAVDVRFDSLDRRLDKFESRVDKRMDDIQSRLNVIESRLTDLFRWSFAFWIGSVAATVALVHYLR